jgi:hypothetical protein
MCTFFLQLGSALECTLGCKMKLPCPTPQGDSPHSLQQTIQKYVWHCHCRRLLLLQGNKSFFSEIIASISDIRFSRDGRYILSRDYMNLKLWDMAMENKPVVTLAVHEELRPRVRRGLYARSGWGFGRSGQGWRDGHACQFDGAAKQSALPRGLLTGQQDPAALNGGRVLLQGGWVGQHRTWYDRYCERACQQTLIYWHSQFPSLLSTGKPRLC